MVVAVARQAVDVMIGRVLSRRPSHAVLCDAPHHVPTFLMPATIPSGIVYAILPTVDDLRASSYMFCRLAEEHHARVAVLLTRYHDSIDVDGALACQLPYRIAGGHDNSSDGIHLWLETLQEGEHRPDVILLSTEVAPAEADEPSDAWVQLLFPDAAVIRLPRQNLHVSDWMGSLTLDEWKSACRPRFFCPEWISDIVQTGTNLKSRHPSSPATDRSRCSGYSRLLAKLTTTVTI